MRRLRLLVPMAAAAAIALGCAPAAPAPGDATRQAENQVKAAGAPAAAPGEPVVAGNKADPGK